MDTRRAISIVAMLALVVLMVSGFGLSGGDDRSGRASARIPGHTDPPYHLTDSTELATFYGEDGTNDSLALALVGCNIAPRLDIEKTFENGNTRHFDLRIKHGWGTKDQFWQIGHYTLEVDYQNLNLTEVKLPSADLFQFQFIDTTDVLDDSLKVIDLQIRAFNVFFPPPEVGVWLSCRDSFVLATLIMEKTGGVAKIQYHDQDGNGIKDGRSAFDDLRFFFLNHFSE